MRRTPREVMETYLDQVVTRGHLGLLDELAHENMIDEANAAFGGPPGRAGLVAHVEGFRRNVELTEVSVDRIVAGDSEVMAQWRFTGIHAGPWLGRAPTGRSISGTVFSFFEIESGLIRRYRLWLHAEFPEPVVFDSARPER